MSCSETDGVLLQDAGMSQTKTDQLRFRPNPAGSALFCPGHYGKPRSRHVACFEQLVTVALVVAGLVVSGVFSLVVSAVTAPEGYQDREGFHLGKRPRSVTSK